MKKYLTIVPLLFLLAGITFAQDKVPKLVVKSFEHDFGKIKEGVKVSHTFELKNEGNADLVIEGVAPSWGCTASDFDKVIPPGQAGKITLSLLPSGTGIHTKYASVTTTDPKLGEFQLTVKFEVFVPRGYRVGSYLFNPSNEVSVELKLGQRYETQVGIYNDSGRLVEIKKTVTNNPNFTVNLDTVEPGKAFKLNIASTDKLPVGTNKMLIKLMTDDSHQSVLEVTVMVKVADEKASGAEKIESEKPAAKSWVVKKR
jgi:hypothetical protein